LELMSVLPFRSLAACAATARGGWADDNDDRWFADPERGLFYVADGSGPTYGGYHAPFALDSGLAAFLQVFDAADGAAAARLRQALEAAHRQMRRSAAAYDAAVAEISKTEGPPLHASLRAADFVRPPRWEHVRGQSFAHFTGSLTACHVGPEGVAVVQVGSNRAYLWRAGRIELLLHDHTLGTALESSGEAVDLAQLRFHRGVVVNVLGFQDELVMTEANRELRPGDRLLLCSDGLWAADDGESVVKTLLESPLSEREHAACVSSIAARDRRDATVVSIAIS
jgi:serine/threonine protein phosphatase PrpC